MSIEQVLCTTAREKSLLVCNRSSTTRGKSTVSKFLRDVCDLKKVATCVTKRLTAYLFVLYLSTGAYLPVLVYLYLPTYCRGLSGNTTGEYSRKEACDDHETKSQSIGSINKSY